MILLPRALTALLLLLTMQAPATQAKWLGQKPCKPDEKGYLLTLYQFMDGENWKVQWDISINSDPCINSWNGIVCNEHGAVTAILLPRNNLKGKMPQDMRLGRFEALQELDLSNNRIEGRLPGTLSYATKLRKLNVADNYMVGPLLDGLGSLPDLEYLDFSYNLFSGDVPDSYVDQRESGCVVIENGYKENFITRATSK
mmetsp:Transcript_37103/g.100119  ORF Transcript_37103/g.100119 Transcript_37103/m.100119 type:complete len:199 (-) Transcript_37103:1866-2462(-)